MDARIKKLWVEALRSGEFQQGQSTLRYNELYCCLGVLCELHRRETGKGEWRRINYVGDGYMPIGQGPHLYYLPPEVQVWAGLKEENPVLKTAAKAALAVFEKEATCSYLNDRGKTFEEIAHHIEASL